MNACQGDDRKKKKKKKKKDKKDKKGDKKSRKAKDEAIEAWKSHESKRWHDIVFFLLGFLMLLSLSYGTWNSLAAPFFSLDFLSSFRCPVSSFVERPLPGARWHDRPGQVGNRLVKTVKTQNLT